MAALTKEVGYLLGVPVDYYASVDLDGFRKLIDRVGGVTVNVQTAINDPVYGGWDTPGKIGFKISTGKHTLDGETALAFVRSRKTLGDSDFGRAARQQQLLVALQRKLVDPAMLPNLPGSSRTRPRRSRRTSRPTASRRFSSWPAGPTRRRSRNTSSGRPTRTTRRTSAPTSWSRT